MRNAWFWKIIQEEPASAALNMQRDVARLTDLADQPEGVLNFYKWSHPSATYGHFIRPSEWLDLDVAKRYGLNLGRRPTGGGIIFHTSDLAFSVLIPVGHPLHETDPLRSYHRINQIVLEAVTDYIGTTPSLLPVDSVPITAASRHFCMAKPTIYDIMLEGRKIGGAAQRRTKAGILHQASLALAPPDEEMLLQLLRPSTGVFDAIQRTSCYLLKPGQDFTTAQRELQAALIARFHQCVPHVA